MAMAPGAGTTVADKANSRRPRLRKVPSSTVLISWTSTNWPVTGAPSVKVCKPSNVPVRLHVGVVLEARKLVVELALVTSTPNELVPIHMLTVLKPSTVLVANRGARRRASMEYD